jgi:hypothetical protein
MKSKAMTIGAMAVAAALGTYSGYSEDAQANCQRIEKGPTTCSWETCSGYEHPSGIKGCTTELIFDWTCLFVGQEWRTRAEGFSCETGY